MLPLCSRSSLAPAAARAAYIPFGVPPSPSLPQDEPPTARGRSVSPAGAAGLTAPNPSRNRARGEEPPAATLSRHGRRSRRTAPCPPRPPFRIRASQRFRPYCISVPCVPWPAAPADQGRPSRPQPQAQACGPALLLLRVQARSPPPSMRTRCSRLPARAPRRSPFNAVTVACSPCARAPCSLPLPLAPLTFRLASLPLPSSLRTSRRQRAVVVSARWRGRAHSSKPEPQPGTRGGAPGSDAVPA